MVILRTPRNKFGIYAEMEGPYVVSKTLSDITYELHMPQHPRHRGIYHINLLEPFENPTAECLHVIERNDMDDFTL